MRLTQVLLAPLLWLSACGKDAPSSGGPCGPGGTCPEGQSCDPETQICLLPGECPPERSLCGKACVSLDSDPNHCGSCAIACGGAVPFCSGRTCVAQCPAGQAACGFACVNLSADRYHCGNCDEVCQGADQCIAGDCRESPCGPCPTDAPLCQDDQCVAECGPGRVHCMGDGICADLSSDVEHCGGCDIDCPEGAECTSGECVCPTTTVDCGNECADLSASEMNCGACGNDCGAFGECQSGNCACQGTLIDCDNGAGADCVDAARDPRNCGGCGMDCGDRQACLSGECVCRPGLSDCDSGPGLACIDIGSDPDHCGGCGDGCADVCLDQQCVSDCGGLDECNNACVDLATHPLHCGDCDNVCETDRVCSEGECRRFRPGLLCDGCPCAACTDDFSECCAYPGTAEVICVDGPCPTAF